MYNIKLIFNNLTLDIELSISNNGGRSDRAFPSSIKDDFKLFTISFMLIL